MLPSAYNVTARSLAKAGQLDEAIAMLDAMQKDAGMAVDHRTVRLHRPRGNGM